MKHKKTPKIPRFSKKIYRHKKDNLFFVTTP